MTEAARKEIGTTRSLVADLRGLLAESTGEAAETVSTDEAEAEDAGIVTLEHRSQDRRRQVAEAAGEGGKGAERKSREQKKSGGGHNPFKRKTTLGPADARPPVKNPRTHKKTGKWKCKCANYKCACMAGKRKKIVRIARGYKAAYNKSYKAWRKKQKG